MADSNWREQGDWHLELTKPCILVAPATWPRFSLILYLT